MCNSKMDTSSKVLFAHRGMSALAPENTLSAFRLTPDYGLKWIECDVDVLSDGTVVVCHDDSLDRCSNYTGSLYTLDKNGLSDIDAGSWFDDAFTGEKIPTLDQLIELVNEKQLNINIEIKSCTAGWQQTLRLIEGVLASIEKLNQSSELLVSCFSPLALFEFKRRSPQTKVACLFKSNTFEDDWLSIVQACQAQAVNLSNDKLTQETVKKVKAQGYEVNVYTVNDVKRANQLFNWGVDGVFTDVGHLFPRKYRS